MDLKVLFTASTYSHILHFHLPYLCRFKERGWTVHVACGGKPEEIPWADEVLNLPFEKRMAAPANFKATGLLRGRIKREGYDLLCTHTSLAAFFTRLALIGIPQRPKVVNMVHGYLFDEETTPHKKTVLLAAERLTAPCTDLVLTMNHRDDEIARKYRLGKHISFVPGVGVDFSRFDGAAEDGIRLREELGISKDAFVLLYAAEFSARKSQSTLIYSMKDLPEQVVLVLAGDGVLCEQCMKEARALGLERRVLFPGYIKDLSRWYAMADAVAASSRSEGLPFNIMEAMYAGLPVVASRVKGHEDLIEHGVTGLLYPYGDSDACAEQIKVLMGSAERRETLAANARKNVRQYDLEQVLPLVMEAYDSVLPASAAAVR